MKNKNSGLVYNIMMKKYEDMLKYKYFGVDFNTVWDFINEDIPALKEELPVLEERLKHQIKKDKKPNFLYRKIYIG